MTTATDAQLCYGIAFDEDTEFPWSGEEFDGEIEIWWRQMLGYRPSFEIFDEDGNWPDGVEPPEERIDAYFEERENFDRDHPALPVEVVHHCSANHPMYILAVPVTSIVAKRGYPVAVKPETLYVPPAKVDALIAFCNAHGIPASPPKWWLSSLWA